MDDKHCKCCGTKHTFTPSLRDRGMTWKEAKSIFIDAKAGMCTPCYLKKCSDDVRRLMRTAGKDHFSRTNRRALGV